MGKQSVWKSYDQKELKEVNAVCERYKTCLDAGKTERECVKLGKKMADTWHWRLRWPRRPDTKI